MIGMKFFKLSFERENGLHERYVMLEKEPEKNSTLESLLAVIPSYPNMEYGGGIHGGKSCPYGMFLPSEAEVEEISIDEFVTKFMESLKNNYVRKAALRDYTQNLLR